MLKNMKLIQDTYLSKYREFIQKIFFHSSRKKFQKTFFEFLVLSRSFLNFQLLLGKPWNADASPRRPPPDVRLQWLSLRSVPAAETGPGSGQSDGRACGRPGDVRGGTARRTAESQRETVPDTVSGHTTTQFVGAFKVGYESWKKTLNWKKYSKNKNINEFQKFMKITFFSKIWNFFFWIWKKN